MNKLSLFALILSFISFSAHAQKVPYRNGNLWGLSDLNGKIVSKPKYDSVEFMYNHLKTIRSKVWKTKKIGLIDSSGKEILAPIYDHVSDFDNFIIVKNNKKTGLFNYKGINLIPIVYDEIEAAGDGFFYLTKNKKKGLARYYNNKLEIKISPKYDEISYIDFDHVFECQINGTSKYLDTLCKPVKYSFPQMDLAVIEDVGSGISMEDIQKASNEQELEKQKYINRLNHKKDLVFKKDSSLFKVIYERKNGLWGVRKCDGQILIPYLFEDIDLGTTDLQDIHSAYRQLYVLKYQGKWGMIGHKNINASYYKDTASYKLIDFKYDSIYCNVNCTYYIITDNGNKGIVSAKDFSKMISPKYLYIRDTYHKLNKESLFWVQAANGKFGYVNDNGTEYFKD
jgi:hypothetical protein